MSLSHERIEFIKQRYGENSRTYKLLIEAEEAEVSNDKSYFEESVNLTPGEDD